MAHELKPCPFCGSIDRISIRRPMQTARSHRFAVWCDTCGIWGPSGMDGQNWAEVDPVQSAADRWNRRAGADREMEDAASS
jgi:Lar family restriction alleviation protein